MRLHILGLAHTETTRDFDWCAFTGKTRRLATMLHDAGMDVVLYAGEENEARCSEHVPLVTRAEQQEWFGHYDFTRDVFRDFDPSHIAWRTMNGRAIGEIMKRSQPGDILGVTMGLAQKVVADACGGVGMQPVEVGVGYSGIFAAFRVFESWAWRNHLAARYHGETDDVRFFDTVIPNSYDPADFPLGHGDGGFFLYLGRVMHRKGPQVAADACQRLGAKLVVAGQGEMELAGDVEFVGRVDTARRAELLGAATAVFCPSLYLEPFCGVSVEAQLCGTPVIASNWGALVENVSEGSGFLCDMLAEFVSGAELAPSLDRAAIRKHAVGRWSCDVVVEQYLDYFGRLRTLPYPGWYA